MSEDRNTREGAEKLTREDRLAAKLRENLRRRKAQARAVSAGADAGTGGESIAIAKPPLAKSPPES